MSTGADAAFDALAVKVEELGRVCAWLSRENAELRTQVSELRAGGAPGAGRRGVRAQNERSAANSPTRAATKIAYRTAIRAGLKVSADHAT